jgi:hypothetical protein
MKYFMDFFLIVAVLTNASALPEFRVSGADTATIQVEAPKSQCGDDTSKATSR